MPKTKSKPAETQATGDSKRSSTPALATAILIVGLFCIGVYMYNNSENTALRVKSSIDQAKGRVTADQQALIEVKTAYKRAKDNEGFWRRNIFPDSAEVKALQSRVDSDAATLEIDQQKLCTLQPSCEKLRASQSSGHSLHNLSRGKVAATAWGTGILIVVVIALVVSGAAEVIGIFLLIGLVIIGILELLWKTIEWVF